MSEPTELRQPGACTLCGRVIKRGTAEHHLIPRKCHRNKWFQKRSLACR